MRARVLAPQLTLTGLERGMLAVDIRQQAINRTRALRKLGLVLTVVAFLVRDHMLVPFMLAMLLFAFSLGVLLSAQWASKAVEQGSID